MARKPRKQCESNIYHLIIRGVGQQIIFEDDNDRTFFMKQLSDAFSANQVDLYAWCLMSNHVHLLTHAPIERISKAMQALQSIYATAFNRKHERTGVLFQGRFTSVAIADDRQLLAAVRYIHLNPVKIGGALNNPWSSYREYVDDTRAAYADGRLVLSITEGLQGFVRLHETDATSKTPKENTDAACDYERAIPRERMSESQALATAKQTLGDLNPYVISSLEKAQRNEAIRRLYAAGLSIPQIVRVTGIGRGVVWHAVQ